MTTRVAPSFLRVGHFELFGRRTSTSGMLAKDGIEGQLLLVRWLADHHRAAKMQPNRRLRPWQKCGSDLGTTPSFRACPSARHAHRR